MSKTSQEKVKDLERQASFFGVDLVVPEGCDPLDWHGHLEAFGATFPRGSWQMRARKAWLGAMRRFFERDKGEVFDSDAWLAEWIKRNPRP